jgi:hypothetical protein
VSGDGLQFVLNRNIPVDMQQPFVLRIGWTAEFDRR